jgi:hypothetical protein
MAIRVTDDEVKELIDTEEPDLTPFITAANVLVEKILANDSSLTSDQLKQIELWLSAHFVAIKDPVAKTESIGGTSVSHYLSGGSGGLKMTPYGEMACVLDTSGKLVSMGKRKAGFEAIDLEL